MRFQLGAMTVGDILDRGLRVMLSRLGAFYLIQVVALLPFLALTIGTPFIASGDLTRRAVLAAAAVILFVIFSQIASAAILHIIHQEYISRSVSVGQALNFAFGKFGPLFWTSFLLGLIMSLVYLVGGMIILCLGGAAAFAGGPLGIVLIVPMIIGLGVFLFIVYLWYCMSSQVVVVENQSGMPALNRSKVLGTGFRLRLFGILLLLWVLGLAVALTLGIGLEFVLPTGGAVIKTGPNPFDLTTTPANQANQAIHQVIVQLVNVGFGTYWAVCLTLLYFDLRVRKEGFDLELAAQQGIEPAESL